MAISSYLDIIERLKPLGIVRLFGSARIGREFINNHDIDIGIITEYRSKDFLIEKCVDTAEYYNSRYHPNRLPLHFIIIGDFEQEFIYIRMTKNHMIQFVPKKWSYLIWILLRIKKWKESLYLKS